MPDETGLRERKKAATRQSIAEAAMALATERGPADVTVDDIAAAADVSPRTVFNYFPSKEAAILGLDPERRRDLIERILDRPAGEPAVVSLREALRGGDSSGAVAWRARARLAHQHPQLQPAYIASLSSLEAELSEAIAQRLGSRPGDPLPRLLVAVAITTLRVAVDAAVEAGSDVDAAIDQAFAALADGFRSAVPHPNPRNRQRG